MEFVQHDPATVLVSTDFRSSLDVTNLFANTAIFEAVNYTPGIFTYTTLNLSGATSVKVVALASSAAAVPEPESWAMMIGGLGIVGAAMRRRRGMNKLPPYRTAEIAG